MSTMSIDVSNLNTAWNTTAHSHYERRQGGATNAVAKHILTLSPPLNTNSLILDSCCGTGAFTCTLLKSPTSKSTPTPLIHAIDNSPGMIEIMQSLIAQNGWQEIVKAEKMDATNLKFPDDMFDLSVTSFGIFFFPDPVKGVKEIYRTLKSGGVAFVTSWKGNSYIPIFYEVQKVVQPAKHMVLQVFEAWMKEETMEGTLKRGLFSKVELESLDVMIVQKDMDEMIDILAIRFRDFVGDEWTENEKMKLHSATRKVITEQRGTFVVDLDESGKVGLPMCAWIAIGTK